MLTKNGLCYIMGDIFTDKSGHPVNQTSEIYKNRFREKTILYFPTTTYTSETRNVTKTEQNVPKSSNIEHSVEILYS
jgi:hypothetical protein